MKKSPGHFWPLLTLFFLAPALGELLSGSAPPFEFFHPFGLLLLGVLYGGGAILARELRVRWHRGWPTVLALGLAYGILEEGLMVKSFFDPQWMDLGLLGSYGRWAGVNWVWTLQLTLYHALFSIAAPILLVEHLYPQHRDQPWLRRRGLVAMGLLLLADVAVGFFLLTTYRPPLIPYGLAAAAAAGLVLLARRLPARWGRPRPGPIPRPPWFALLGFGAALSFFLVYWLLPELALPVPLTLLCGVGWALLLTGLVRWMSRGGAWGAAHPLALASGAMGFFALLAPLQEMDPARTDDPRGMALVGLATLLFLAWLWRRAV
ncbi:MAG: hypothetical protein JXA37_00710 [Chloroflexia bacterium]|nr:hypothetical protein [Chloroflexia bacterium]